MTVISLLILLTAVFASLTSSAGADDVLPVSATFDKDTQPFAFVIPQLPVVEGTTGLKASECGVCHVKIYEDWKGSTHAHAISDLQFIAEVSKAASPRWLCLNCHIPIQNQRRSKVVGLIGGNVLTPRTVPNEEFDEALRLEGISCTTCHVRVDDETKKSYIIGPNGSEQSPHPVRKNPSHLRTICIRCHDPKGESITPNLVCWFTSKAELEEGQAILKERYGSQRDCVDCHMPEEEARVAVAPPDLPVRKLNRHYWLGGGVPKENELFDTLLERGFRSGLDVAVRPFEWEAGRLRIAVEITNSRAGHYVPTGDPERFVLTLVRLTDASGEVIAQDRARVGQVWEWNPARKISDNRIKMGETRNQSFDFSGVDRDRFAKVEVEVLLVKLSSTNVKHMMQTDILKDVYPGAPERIKRLDEIYPTAASIHLETFDALGSRTDILGREQLIARSKAFVNIPLDERDY